MLTNARSLSPKIRSLHTMFEEHELDVALITESWLKDGSVLNRDVIDLEFGTNLKIIYKNRPLRRVTSRVVGGGVSIIYDKTRCSLRERKIVGNKFELVAAVGKIGKIARPVAFFCAYLEPRMKKAEVDALNELVCHQILELKAAKDHLIFLGGDLNKKNLSDAVRDFPDIQQINHDPTRGNSCLDIVFSNSSHATPSTWPPLETPDGVKSDHLCVLLKCREQQPQTYKWIKKKVRKQTDKACAKFVEEVKSLDWMATFGDDDDPDSLVEKYERTLGGIVDRLFPWVTVKQRSNEAPWVTQGMRRLGKKKRRVYKREGKSRLWHVLQQKSDDLQLQSRDQYVDKATKAGPKAYYRAVKNLACNGKQSEWNVMDLFPGKTIQEAGRSVSSFFTEITNSYKPLQPQRTLPDQTRQPITLEQTRQWMKDANKPDSMVEGDLIPRLMKLAHWELSRPVQRIFNAVFASGKWPAAWKVETTVIIPKTTNPASLAECRNISCTAFLSKVLESVLLADLRKELLVDPDQYGGLKKCSVNHLLVELFDAVLAPLDEGNPAVVMGIDFEKAFNRLDHAVCLRELRQLGASEASITLVRSFLTERKMQVKIDGQLSECCQLKGGSPQGSILGSLLYCIATQRLSDRNQQHNAANTPPAARMRRAAPAAGSPQCVDRDEQEEEESFGLV